MNTPKLNSILSSTIGNIDPARAGRSADPVHGLDFSQLLGERRNQVERAEFAPRRETSSAPDRLAERNTAADRSASPRNNNASTPNSSKTDARATDRSDRSPSNSANAPATNNAGGSPSRETAGRSSDSKASANTGAEGRTDVAQATDAQAQNGAPIAGDTAAQAQQAIDTAETGLPAAAANTMLQPLLVTGQPAQAAGTAANAGAGFAATPLAVQPDATAADPAVLAAMVSELDADLPESTLTANGRPVFAQGPAAAATPLAAAAFAELPAGVEAPASILTGAAQAAANNADARAATAAPLPIAVDVSSTAAARSLQEFTAMVEAARATSGTSLQANAVAQPAPAAAAPTLPGLMPAGAFAAQGNGQALPTATIAAPLNSPQWNTEFGRQFISIAQAANGAGQVAELRLDPPELGPLRITINLNDSVAHAVFSSPHAAVRQTVENALPQLQQMLEQAGISLGQANVNDQGQPSGDDARGTGTPADSNGNAGANVAASGVETGTLERRPADPNALVDTFA